MSTQTEKSKDNLLVKLVKKSVGLPTSDCCGAPASAQEQEAESCCGEQPSATTETSGCGCGGQSSCCSEQEQEVQSENKAI